MRSAWGVGLSLAAVLAMLLVWSSGAPVADIAPAAPASVERTMALPAVVPLPSLPKRQDASPAPAPPPARIASFGAERDLWAYASQGLGLDSVAELLERHAAARECQGFARLLPDLSAFLGGAPDPAFSGAVTPERQLAVIALTQRCHGFVAAGETAGRQLGAALLARARALGMPEVQVLSGSATLVEQALPTLAAQAAAAAGGSRQAQAAEQQAAGMAALLAACDAGKDCAPTSYAALLHCALTGVCGGPLWQGWQDGMAAEEVARVQHYRRLLLHALHSRDLGLLQPRPPASAGR